ncbi:MAG: hypothetical protein WBL93_01715 [Lutisporaceae bacterium]
MKKIICTLLVIVMLSSFMFVFADTVVRDSAGQSFTASWELYANDKTWVMRYGFDASLLTSDYCHTIHSTNNHIARLSNDNGIFSAYGSAGQWALVDVVHAGKLIYYSITF